MSLEIYLKSKLDGVQSSLKSLAEKKINLAQAQAQACSRGQCGGADFEAGAVPYQHEIADLDNQISKLQTQEKEFKSEIQEEEKKKLKPIKLELRGC
jgi:predicted  nucleic acid-binding Zn ribbon protein